MAKKKKKAPAPSSVGKKSFHKHVERALANGHSILMHYQKLNGRTVKRKIEPRSWRGNTLVAYDHKRKATRSFRMERVKHMEKAAFWAGFEKEGSAFAHAAELGGLGVLAAPAIQHLRGKEMSEGAKAKTEVAGLGILAAPSLHAAGKGLLSRMAHR